MQNKAGERLNNGVGLLLFLDAGEELIDKELLNQNGADLRGVSHI